MWVYDGEEWIHDDGSYEPSAPKRPEPRPQWPAELGPELQVIEVEIVQVPRNSHVPVPLPK